MAKTSKTPSKKVPAKRGGKNKSKEPIKAKRKRSTSKKTISKGKVKKPRSKKPVVRTPDTSWHGKFIKSYQDTRSISKSALVVGKNRSTIFTHRKNYPLFDQAVREAWETSVDDLESAAMERAIEGWDEPVFHEGSECGEKRKFSNSLTIFMLKCNRGRYRDNGGGDHDPETIARALMQAQQAMDSSVPSAPEIDSNGDNDDSDDKNL